MKAGVKRAGEGRRAGELRPGDVWETLAWTVLALEDNGDGRWRCLVLRDDDGPSAVGARRAAASPRAVRLRAAAVGGESLKDRTGQVWEVDARPFSWLVVGPPTLCNHGLEHPAVILETGQPSDLIEWSDCELESEEGARRLS